MAELSLPFGTTDDGAEAHLHILTNSRGMAVCVTDLGACLVSVKVPDKRGNLVDVALGWGGAQGYEHNDGALGATVGRVANRIAGAGFELDGTTYTLAANEGANSLHSGPYMWYERLWELTNASDHQVTFGLYSRAGDQGYPGGVSAHVTYRLSDDNVLTIFQSALPDMRTPINLTNHSYWNLNGHASGDVLGHSLAVHADSYLAVDDQNIPLGDPVDVAGTPFDLREPRVLADCVKHLPHGYDHNFCLALTGKVQGCARLVGDRSGIVMDMATDAPGVQVYTGYHLALEAAKDGASYDAFAGVALEPQGWPDAIHHEDWPEIVHAPDWPFTSTTTFAFSTGDAQASDDGALADGAAS